MELHLSGRGTRITDRIREVSEHKLTRLERMEPKLTRLEIEVIAEHNPRQGGIHRVEVVATMPRKTFRAHAEAREVESALDVVAERLERQIRDHHEKKRSRMLASRRQIVRSGKAGPIPEAPTEAEAEADG
jgi:putative sigma-54 modulation protein